MDDLKLVASGLIAAIPLEAGPGEQTLKIAQELHGCVFAKTEKGVDKDYYVILRFKDMASQELMGAALHAGNVKFEDVKKLVVTTKKKEFKVPGLNGHADVDLNTVTDVKVTYEQVMNKTASLSMTEEIAPLYVTLRFECKAPIV